MIVDLLDMSLFCVLLFVCYIVKPIKTILAKKETREHNY